MKYIPTLTWYLEMKEQPAVHTELPEGFSIEEYNEPKIEEYLEVYNAVGEKYNWFDRLLMPKDLLKEIIGSKHTRILLLKESPHPIIPSSEGHGETAGFAEFNLSVPGEVEIVYFGLADRFTGRKAGSPFLLKIVELAWNLPDRPWNEKINRVWLHTCDLDHPAALPLYQKAGFIVYKSEMIMQPVMPENK